MIVRIKNLPVLFVFLGVVISILFCPSDLNAAKPYGANITSIINDTAMADAPLGHAAQAGNVTELNIYGYSTTQSWQGYYGNVSGAIQLADSDDNILYNWSLASPEGEVYASTNGSVLWTNIQCFNFTSTGDYSDDSGNRGGTSQYGTNLTQLEALYGIEPDDVDGVNETFALNSTPEAHERFYTNNLEFHPGECLSTLIFDNSGAGVDNNFEEVLLYDPDTRSVVFTSLLVENIWGFDNRTHDFEMLVLENGHLGNIETTNYYFYVELQ